MNVPWSPQPWQRVLVYGLGLSGQAAAALLRRHGVAVVGVDGRRGERIDLGELASDPGVELRLGADPPGLPAHVDGVVLSPGVPADRPLVAEAREQGVPVIAEVELAFHLLQGTVLGITGSNGKSTTTALTGALVEGGGLPAEVCGNIGVPLSLVAEGEPGRVFVVELSSFQLEATDRFRPRAGALLNLSPDHLDRYRDMASYAAAKARLFLRQEPADVAVLNADDPAVAALPVPSRRRLFSRQGPVEDGCHVAGDWVVEAVPGEEPRRLFALADVPLAGRQNLENAMAAALLALAAGAPAASLAASLRGFQGLPHRIERVAEVAGVTYYDDSKGTNVGATARALEGFGDRSVHLILGGRAKSGIDELVPLLASKARRVYLIGEAAGAFARSLGDRVAWVRCETLDRAVPEAAAAAGAGEVVLLSPACASFDQYTSYAQRGEHFKKLV
ncbi:MAG TPA: UDP-N-acetylmuramoyl-L-alanine--D-glutamate ligase, partial [Thermoanaerobaculia bacterium]|nr:UDP-N-acetylmuramoyl-L-alanine--D-glutamate ligase [Thermoanaerobaculia bacterium]